MSIDGWTDLQKVEQMYSGIILAYKVYEILHVLQCKWILKTWDVSLIQQEKYCRIPFSIKCHDEFSLQTSDAGS